MGKRLAELLREGARGAWTGPDQVVQRIEIDSRRTQAGDLFVALKGQDHDGHAFLGQAFAQGALAAVGEEEHAPPPGRTYLRVPDSRQALAHFAAAFYGHPTRALAVVGVTGTKGKTSVAHFAAAALGGAACLSTITNARRGLPNTTPGPLVVQRSAAQALRAGQAHLVLEVSAHALRQHRVLGVDFDLAVFTNLSQDHFDDFAGFEDYFATKARLFERLKPEALALVNVDDPFGRRLTSRTRARVLTFGLSSPADLRATELNLGREGSRFTVHTPRGTLRLHTPFPGRFYVYNLLAAVGVGLACNVPKETLKARLEAVRHLEGRLERLRLPNGALAVVDFAHSPASLEQVLRFLRGHYPRVIAVFGCGGESDPTKRPLMGRISGELADHTLLTHDNPKHEDPQRILRQIESGTRAVTSHYEVLPERAEAIRRAVELAQPGECVLVAGKGHERVQVFNGRERPFHDRAFLIERLGAQPVEGYPE